MMNSGRGGSAFTSYIINNNNSTLGWHQHVYSKPPQKPTPFSILDILSIKSSDDDEIRTSGSRTSSYDHQPHHNSHHHHQQKSSRRSSSKSSSGIINYKIDSSTLEGLGLALIQGQKQHLTTSSSSSASLSSGSSSFHSPSSAASSAATSSSSCLVPSSPESLEKVNLTESSQPLNLTLSAVTSVIQDPTSHLLSSGSKKEVGKLSSVMVNHDADEDRKGTQKTSSTLRSLMKTTNHPVPPSGDYYCLQLFN